MTYTLCSFKKSYSGEVVYCAGVKLGPESWNFADLGCTHTPSVAEALRFVDWANERHRRILEESRGTVFV